MKVTEKELQRLAELSKIDKTYWDQPGVILAGMDEVGRGPLAGPVVVGCVVMPPEPLLPYVNDSKKLSEKRREALYDQILATSLAHATAWIDPETIDEINILEATKRGFKEAFAKIGVPVTDVLIDALRGLDIPARQHPLIHGDALTYSIGAASILAKVARDRYKKIADDTPEGELLAVVAKSRGFLLAWGVLDTERAARIVLDEFRGGKIAKVTLDRIPEI